MILVLGLGHAERGVRKGKNIVFSFVLREGKGTYCNPDILGLGHALMEGILVVGHSQGLDTKNLLQKKDLDILRKPWQIINKSK